MTSLPLAALIVALLGAEGPTPAAPPAATPTDTLPLVVDALRAAPVVSADRAALKLAVPDFSLAGSAHPDLARVLGDSAARGAAQAAGAGARVLSHGEIVALLGLEKTRQMLGCQEGACLAGLGEALDSDRIVSGSLTILERTALVTVRLIDARAATTLARTSVTLVDATEAELVDAARRLAHEALTGKRLDTSGRLSVRASVAGATVTLDGRSLGETPLAGAQRVLEGPHSIVVQKQGYVRWSTTVTVGAGADVPVDVQLVPIRALSERSRSRLWAWAWTSSGLAVAGAAGGLAFGRLASDSYDRYKLATTRTEASKLRDDTKFRANLANVSYGVGGASAVAAAVLFVSALRADARAAHDAGVGAQAPSAAVVPVPGGVVLAAAGAF